MCITSALQAEIRGSNPLLYNKDNEKQSNIFILDCNKNGFDFLAQNEGALRALHMQGRTQLFKLSGEQVT